MDHGTGNVIVIGRDSYLTQHRTLINWQRQRRAAAKSSISSNGSDTHTHTAGDCFKRFVTCMAIHTYTNTWVNTNKYWRLQFTPRFSSLFTRFSSAYGCGCCYRCRSSQCARDKRQCWKCCLVNGVRPQRCHRLCLHFIFIFSGK